jgi:ribosome-binding factor A
MTRRRRPPTGVRQYPRTARLNELVREIIADELERIDDDRMTLLTITAVDVDGDLRRAKVLFDSLDGEDGDEALLEALGEVRVRLQRAIGSQARIKRTPELTFAPDPAVRAGERIDSILRTIEPSSTSTGDGGGGDPDPASGPTDAAATDSDPDPDPDPDA